VLLSGLTDDWLARQRWSRESIASRFGSLTFEVSTIPYARSYGINDIQWMNMSRFVDYIEHRSSVEQYPRYIFDGRIATRVTNFSDDFRIHKALQFDTRLIQFMFGPSRSGSNFHFHGNAWNALVYGRKLWMMTRPRQAFYSDQHPLQWLENKLNNNSNTGGDNRWPSELIVCIQEAGDVMFVPENYAHAVIVSDGREQREGTLFTFFTFFSFLFCFRIWKRASLWQ
jgi:hypothetical protein